MGHRRRDRPQAARERHHRQRNDQTGSTLSRLATQLSRANPRALPFLYAQEGFWYDAIGTLSEQIDADPADRHLREQRAALLEQVGLNTAATDDRRANP